MRGQLWTGLADGLHSWFLEWQLVQRLRRHVLIAVDTSDSCWQDTEARRRALSAIGGKLQRGDRCAVWTLGRAEKIEFNDERPHQEQLTRALGRFEMIRGGTWATPTVQAMLRETTGVDERRFAVLVSDGEVFDAEALAPLRGSLALLRTGSSGSPHLETVRGFARELSGPADFAQFLACPMPETEIELGWSGDRASRCDEAGAILDGDPGKLDAGQTHLRVVMVGGSKPAPRIRYHAGGASWVHEDLDVHQAGSDPPARVQKAFRSVRPQRLHWNTQALGMLAAGGPDLRLRCLEQKHGAFDTREQLFCGVCGQLLIASSPARRGELPEGIRGFVRFEIVGGTPREPAQPSPEDTGDDAFAVFTDAGGRQWLVLKLL